MTLDEFNNLKIGDFVYAQPNDTKFIYRIYSELKNRNEVFTLFKSHYSKCYLVEKYINNKLKKYYNYINSDLKEPYYIWLEDRDDLHILPKSEAFKIQMKLL